MNITEYLRWLRCIQSQEVEINGKVLDIDYFILSLIINPNSLMCTVAEFRIKDRQLLLSNGWYLDSIDQDKNYLFLKGF